MKKHETTVPKIHFVIRSAIQTMPSGVQSLEGDSLTVMRSCAASGKTSAARQCRLPPRAGTKSWRCLTSWSRVAIERPHTASSGVARQRPPGRVRRRM